MTDAKLRLNAKAAATVSSGTGYREWNVTSQVRMSHDNGVDRGFLIRDATENRGGNQQGFHSREKAPHNRRS